MALWNRWHRGDPAAAKAFPVERLEARVHFSAAAAGTPPAPAANVGAAVTDEGLRVMWDDRSNDETGFIVERSRTQDFADVERKSVGRVSFQWREAFMTRSSLPS